MIHIIAVGGGSGGHVTPILPVLNELQKREELKVDFVVDKGFYEHARGLMEKSAIPVQLHTISSGKLRRYKHFRWFDYLRYPSIIFKNIFDVVKIGMGFLQSLWLLRSKPDVVFAKGGFVSLPLGLAAKVRGIPLVIHDSDARPGLTNKVLSRYARAIATGTPLENYPYKKSISRYTGVPIKQEFKSYTPEEKAGFRRELGFDPDKKLLVIIGGSLGAKSINDAILKDATRLVEADLQVLHVTGAAKLEEVQALKPDSAHYQVRDFIYQDVYKYLAIAEVVVTRASATTIQELAGLGSSVILVPARQLGDQVENAMIYQAAQAALVVDDEAIRVSSILVEEILRLMNDETKRRRLGENLLAFARPQAAAQIAEMIYEVVRK